MGWLLKILHEASVNEEGKLDIKALLNAIQKEFPNHAVPKGDFDVQQMGTTLQDVIVPELFNPYVLNRTMELFSLLNSGVMVNNTEFDNLLDISNVKKTKGPSKEEMQVPSNWKPVYEAKQIRIVAFKHRLG